jgi:hypothetical protein
MPLSPPCAVREPKAPAARSVIQLGTDAVRVGAFASMNPTAPVLPTRAWFFLIGGSSAPRSVTTAMLSGISGRYWSRCLRGVRQVW